MEYTFTKYEIQDARCAVTRIMYLTEQINVSIDASPLNFIKNKVLEPPIFNDYRSIELVRQAMGLPESVIEVELTDSETIFVTLKVFNQRFRSVLIKGDEMFDELYKKEKGESNNA